MLNLRGGGIIMFGELCQKEESRAVLPNNIPSKQYQSVSERQLCHFIVWSLTLLLGKIFSFNSW